LPLSPPFGIAAPRPRAADRRRARPGAAITNGAVDFRTAVWFAVTNTFLTGVTLKVDGGEPLT
jgi:hypothetical protein